MNAFRLEPTARDSLDEINDYTAQRWGEEQAATYVGELFAEFDRISSRAVPWQPLPPGFKLDGYSRRCNKHIIYWLEREEEVRIFAILHERMDQRVRVLAASSVV